METLHPFEECLHQELGEELPVRVHRFPLGSSRMSRCGTP